MDTRREILDDRYPL